MNKDSVRQAMREHAICVIVPTYNNAGTLADVLSGVLEYTDSVIVVNDGSTDATPSLLHDFEERVDVVSYPRNRGKGHALKRGLTHARERGFEYALTIDSDGQHRPSDIPTLVRAVIEHPGALIVGARDLSNVDINGKSSFANKFSNFWFRVQTGKNLPDTQTGYRAYPLRRLHGLSMLTSRYEAELELLVFAAWHGVEIVPVPIDVYYPPRQERVSHFKPALDFTRISVLNTLLCAAAVVYGIPARTYNYFADRRAFGREVKWFTHKKGSRKEAASTVARINRSLFSLNYYVFSSMMMLKPFAYFLFKLGKPTDRKKERYHRKLYNVAHEIARYLPRAKVRVNNPHGESFEKPALIICNHQSHLDLPVLMMLTPRLVFLTNDWVWNNFFFGDLIKYAEYLPVSDGLENLLPKLRDLRDRGYSIVVFPEGTRSEDCTIARFHQGAFYLARELRLDIIPAVLHGAGHVLPKKDFMLRKGRITLDVMRRIPYDPEDSTPLRKIASYFRDMIRKRYRMAVEEREKTDYFLPYVSYKYAWRGWRTVHEATRVLKDAGNYAEVIDSLPAGTRSVAIRNAGIGVIPLLFALVNKETQVYAYIHDLRRFGIASETPLLPPNLHFIHAVWPEEERLDEADLVYRIDDNNNLTRQ